MSNPAKRIGLTMRVVQADGYDEPRDALAQDWSGFLASHAPEIAWLPIPNIGPAVAGALDDWNVDGLVLTGGEDLGISPRRDQTERTLIELGLERRMPMFGVCRGMQHLLHYFGAEISQLEGHVAVTHELELTNDAAGVVEALTVNSFHSNGFRVEDLPDGFVARAVAHDGSVEECAHRDLPISAVMWHPERVGPDGMADYGARRLRACFGLGPS